jgi:uncharacterized cofD-like protein
VSDTIPSTSIKVVTIGGGTGLSTVLFGLKDAVRGPGLALSISDLAAIVAVTDDGGSSGRLRTEFQMLPPGDIRNCMVALSEDSLLLSRLFRHRFTGQGGLSGHSFGNIFLAALTDMTGDFAEAVRLSSGILASKGHIYPATNANVHLLAELKDGTVASGETNISKVGPAIQRLYLEPETCHPMPEAIAAIEFADLITIGPGSLYTSLLPPLLVHGVAKAIGSSKAIRIFVSNLMTQPGETSGFSATHHLSELDKYAPEIKFDYVILNNKPISDEQAERYKIEGSQQIGLSEGEEIVSACGAKVVYANLLDDGEKVRHDPKKLTNTILSCAAGATTTA